MRVLLPQILPEHSTYLKPHPQKKIIMNLKDERGLKGNFVHNP